MTPPQIPAATAEEEEEKVNATNPFELATTESQQPEEDEDDDDDQSVHSAASLALRQDFIRLTTQSVTEEEDDDDDDEGADLLNTSNLTGGSSPRRGRPSLAGAPSTPKICWLFLPLFCLLAHALFAMGQTLPMWRLSLTAEDISVWANATSGTSQWAYKALDLPQHAHFGMDQNTTVQTFTYGFAVRELWEAKGMPGTTVPRIAAAMLVLASGIWPHLKLILLQFTWWTSGQMAQAPQQRTRALSWLALLGKWSLADVLVVCVMVGVLNLEWIIEPTKMKAGIMDHMQTLLQIAQLIWKDHEICTKFLHFETSDCGASTLSVVEKLKCRGCKTFVHEAFDRPEWVQKHGKPVLKDIATSGGGAVRLSVVGMHGIYYFCAAVCLSVLLSVVVEWYNHRYMATLRQDYRRRHGPLSSRNHSLSLLMDDEERPAVSSQVSDISEPLLGPGEHDEDGDDDDMGFQAMEIMEDDQSVLSYVIQRTTASPAYKCFQCQHIVPMLAVAFVYLAIYLPSMERHVGGAIPKLMRDILGVELDKAYSLQTLKETCGAAGGWDLFLQATFGLFIVVGPLLRAVLVFVVAMSKSSGSNTQRIRSLFVSTSNFLAAFCAWEVFLVGLIMVGLIMPSATSTILSNKACRQLSDEGTSSCLQVHFFRVPSAFACLVTGFLLVGGLAIHVSLEDQHERMLLENHEGRIAAAAPNNAVNADGQYYVEVASGGDDGNDEDGAAEDPRRRAGANEHGGVATMIEQENV